MGRKVMEGKIILISGPSGVGKNTLIDAYKKEYGTQITQLVSATTREPRRNNGVMEQDGVEYHFKDQAYFDRTSFLEKNEVFPGKWYGTPLRGVITEISNGHYMLKDLDIEGAMLAKKGLEGRGLGDSVYQIGILPENLQVLKDRMRERDQGIDQARIERAQLEIDLIRDNVEGSYIVINRDLKTAHLDFQKIANSIYQFEERQ
ncbi:MAG: guanylate kinase [Patescibacteria group bacterium]|jgi:guanylate kinase